MREKNPDDEGGVVVAWLRRRVYRELARFERLVRAWPAPREAEIWRHGVKQGHPPYPPVGEQLEDFLRTRVGHARRVLFDPKPEPKRVIWVDDDEMEHVFCRKCGVRLTGKCYDSLNACPADGDAHEPEHCAEVAGRWGMS